LFSERNTQGQGTVFTMGTLWFTPRQTLIFGINFQNRIPTSLRLQNYPLFQRRIWRAVGLLNSEASELDTHAINELANP